MVHNQPDQQMVRNRAEKVEEEKDVQEEREGIRVSDKDVQKGVLQVSEHMTVNNFLAFKNIKRNLVLVSGGKLTAGTASLFVFSKCSLQEKLSNMESENQVLRQQALLHSSVKSPPEHVPDP
ncbi:hypothetical protein BHE74_00009206 [Ensete ventricosum]|nr:hypothetical protein GW17_00001328 [Ensete ventricosum]RWW82335.1 hypothetical protein BHE74_00009206 [Ensete ventricosum]RZR86023.1 hypothetical protein BHM03_00013113 [Ensete ventricosum]